MKTLEDLIIEAKCRSGKPYEISEDGAYWLYTDRITLKRTGGDGIGQSTADISYILELRHYRNDDVRAIIIVELWHENYGKKTEEINADSVLSCTCVEELIIALLKLRDEREGKCCDTTFVRPWYWEHCTGLPLGKPAPDDII
jgi:hypothetical protein